MTRIRCAIYTRKSSEEGLEQDFNSLDAQHEACAAYIKSQTSEGWKPARERYDDGGISGGSLERPGLKRLLADIAAGQVDVVVVYKVDRLTRSLLDFAKLVEAFDKAGTSFVSVTQSFNTTTSMGRLTLNMLLSFAQFEREVTAERIRDKIAASKARGMWMGGTPPIGYRPDGRSLAIVEEHAATVRRIFERYRELGRVSAVVDELESDGVHSPQRLTTGGRSFGGRPFSRGQVYKLLSNTTYIGRIDHGGRSHQANHQAIVSAELFEAVQAILAANLNGHRRGHRAHEESLLAGLLVDDRGVPMVASHACKGKVRYRYYVSRDLQQAPDARSAPGWRLPAREIEPLVRVRLASALRDPIGLLAAIDVPLPDADGLKTLIDRGSALATDVESRSAKGSRLARRLIANVRLAPQNVALTLDAASVVGLLELDPPSASRNIELSIPARLRRSGMAMKLILEDSRPANRHVDGTLVQLIHRGRLWWKELLSDPKLTLEGIGRREGLTGGYVLRLVRLAFLDPAILSAIVDGDAPAHLSADRLTGPDAMTLRWIDQQSQFGFWPLR